LPEAISFSIPSDILKSRPQEGNWRLIGAVGRARPKMVLVRAKCDGMIQSHKREMVPVETSNTKDSSKMDDSTSQAIGPNDNWESFAIEVGPPAPSRRWLFAILLVLAVGAIGIGVQYLPSLQWVVDRENSLRNWIAARPMTSWILGLFLYVGLSLLPGTAGKSIVFGWLFGFVAAVILVEIGLTAAAVLSFLLGRFAVKRILHRRWHFRLQMISQKFSEDGALFLLWLRLAHAPFTLVNYGAGSINIPLVTFWWTTHLGILPATLVFTFLGSRIPNMQTVVEQGAWAIVDPTLLFVLTATAFLPLLFRPLIKSLKKRL